MDFFKGVWSIDVITKILVSVTTVASAGLAGWYWKQSRRTRRKANVSALADHLSLADGRWVFTVIATVENIGELPLTLSKVSCQVFDFSPKVGETLDHDNVHASRLLIASPVVRCGDERTADVVYPKERNLYRFDGVAPAGVKKVLIEVWAPNVDDYKNMPEDRRPGWRSVLTHSFDARGVKGGTMESDVI